MDDLDNNPHWYEEIDGNFNSYDNLKPDFKPTPVTQEQLEYEISSLRMDFFIGVMFVVAFIAITHI